MEIIVIEEQIKETQSRIDYLCFCETLGGDYTSSIQELEDRIAKLRAQLKELEK